MSRVVDNSWSRRRAAVQAEAEADRKAAELAARAEKQAELEDKSDAEILSELKLQDPDAMQPGDDFSAFMRDEVPERLRKRALRALWRSNPVLACVDDLVEYGEDFKAEWTPGEVVRTAYQVGKGMMAHVEEMERQAAEEAADVAEAPEEHDEPLPEDVIEDAPEPVLAQGDTEAPAPLPEFEEEPQYTPTRRMRFEFDGAA